MGFDNYFSDTGAGSVFTVHILLCDLLIISLIQALVLCSLFTFYYGILNIISLIQALVLCSLFTFYYGIC